MLTRRELSRSALALAAMRFAIVRGEAAEARPHFATDPFVLGVASGDPHSSGFVIWTRLLGAEALVKVRWEVSQDDAFRQVVRNGDVTASPDRAHAVHVELASLPPGRRFFYRFHCGDATSPTGRCATLPASPERLRIALACCQHWEQGWFSAYRDMIAQGPDALLHVGDYIYEKSFGAGPDVRKFGTSDPQTLGDYRARYALYRSDPDLAAAHAAMPFIVTWDDHEVENDYAADQGVATVDPRDFLRRRAAAYQAYFEHMPIAPWRFHPGRMKLYRKFSFGDLASLYVLDARQYRSPQACGAGGRIVTNCDEVSEENRSMLGARQEGWLAGQLGQERATWSLIGQQTLLSRLRLPQNDDAVYTDIWDGYPAARRRLVGAMQQPAVRNPVVLSGDVHSFWLNDIREDFRKPESPVVAPEIVTSCLASRNGPDDLFNSARALNSHVRYVDNAHAGYVMLDLTDRLMHADYRAVNDLTDPTSACRSLSTFEVPSRAGRT